MTAAEAMREAVIAGRRMRAHQMALAGGDKKQVIPARLAEAEFDRLSLTAVQLDQREREAAQSSSDVQPAQE